MRSYFKNKSVLINSRDTDKALEEIGLNWKVAKIQNKCYFEGSEVITPAFSIVRTDTKKAIGTVTDMYQPIQNTTALSSFTNALIGAGNAEIVNGGEYNGGKQVYLTLKLNKSHVISDDDVIEYYLQMFTSHDGKSSLTGKLLGLRLICTNGMVGLATEGEFKIRHSLNAHLNIAQARTKLGIIYNQLDSFKEIANKLAQKVVLPAMTQAYFAKVFNMDLENLNSRQQNKLYDLDTHFRSGRGSDLKSSKGTAWGAYQAVLEYLDYGQNSKDNTRSNTLGAGYQAKQRALVLAQSI